MTRKGADVLFKEKKILFNCQRCYRPNIAVCRKKSRSGGSAEIACQDNFVLTWTHLRTGRCVSLRSVNKRVWKVWSIEPMLSSSCTLLTIFKLRLLVFLVIKMLYFYLHKMNRTQLFLFELLTFYDFSSKIWATLCKTLLPIILIQSV